MLPFLKKTFGVKVIGENYHFSDHGNYPYEIDWDVPGDRFTINTDAAVLGRPEGSWDRPGILEESAKRAPTNPVAG